METIVEEIYELLKKKVGEQAAYDRAAYEALVDETVEYFKEKGKLTDDDNEEFIKEQLCQMYETMREEAAK